IDAAILVEGNFVPAFERGSGDVVLPMVLQNLGSAPNDLVWLMKYLNNTYTQGEPCMVLRSNKNVLGSDLRVVISQYGGVAIWPVEGPEARPIPKSPYDPTKINALAIDGDIVFGDHLVHARTVITNLRRLPLALPYATLNSAITATDTTISVTQGVPQLPTDFPYRAVIWNGLNTTSAEIVIVNSLTSITRAQDGTTAVSHNAGDKVTRALNIQQDGAITNLLSGAERGSEDFFGGAGIAMQPIGRTDEANGSVFLDAFGRGTDKDSNCIFFRTRDVNSQISTERARITSDGSIEHYVDNTKDCLYHRSMFRFNDITNSAWTTIATISPSTVTNVHRRGYVKAVVSAQRDTVGGGHLRISQWEFNINNAAPVPAFIGSDTTVGTPGSIPNFRLATSGNNVLVQIQGGSANNSDGTAFLEIYLPYDASGATWSVT
ncbi:MAG TPA: hypothetical protein ACFYEA_11545, partial [Candidatus Tripitaka californicus]|uniref:hypothetical protein n=1 Tax=Candidatus Tripitaka californicus TaxID=3367616 RepID=UPI004026C009